MTRQTVRFASSLLASVLSGLTAAATDVFVSPRIATQAGYENNRMAESDGEEGSAFWQACPGLDVTVLGAKTETSLGLDYRRTQYTKSGFETKDEASAVAQWRYFEGLNEAGASISGGLYRDQALPNDDHTFWQARPYFVRTLENLPAEISLKGSLRQTLYNSSMYTSATDRTDSQVDLRPELRWHLSHRVTVWAELYAEYNASDAGEADYSGFGGAMGCEFRPAARLDLGAWAGIGTRPYAQKTDGENRRDTPMPAGAWATYRLRPWLELFSALDWASYASTLDYNDNRWWRVGGGLKVVLEHDVGSK
jgi:hypothetical protein